MSDRFGIQIDREHFADAVASVYGQLDFQIAAASGIGKDFDHYVRRTVDAVIVIIKDMKPIFGYEQYIRLKSVVLVDGHIVGRDSRLADVQRICLQSELNVKSSREHLMRVIGPGHFDEFSLDKLVAHAPV